MPTQTAAERNRLAATRSYAVNQLEDVVRSLERFLNPTDNRYLCPPELRADPAVQMILSEQLNEIREALLLLNLQRQCTRCQVVLPEAEVRDGYCNKH